jgi:hypothetical protein
MCAIYGGGFIVFTDSQNRPLPHPRYPLDQTRKPPRSSSLHRAIATPRELSALARVVILPAVGAILGTSALLHSGQDEEHGGQL